MAMAEMHERIANALLRELIAQGQGGGADGAVALTSYPVSGHIDIPALAGAIEEAIGESQSEDGVPPGHLNATNDG